MGNRRGYLVGNETTEVASVIVEGDTTMSVLNHQIVDLVDTTFERLHQSTTSDDGIKLHWDISLTQLIEYQLTAEVLLLYHIVEMREFLSSVDDIADEHRCLVFEDSHLRRRGAWIDDKNLHIAANANE